MTKRVIHASFVSAGFLLLAAGTAFGQQDYGKIETAPQFAYIHNSPILGGSQGFNCAGLGGTVSYNLNSMLGVAADLSSCKGFGYDDNFGVGSKVSGNQFVFVFGPRLTYRKHRIQPFGEINFGGERVSVHCNNGNFGNACGSLITNPVQAQALNLVRDPFADSASKTAFAMTVGGGADFKINKKFSIRLAQLEYLYTHFGNGCSLAICSNNNGQNNFRLKSGLVVNWGSPK